MKRCAMVLLACAALAGLVSGRAVAAIPVKVASSVGTDERNYVNVTYGKLVELAQKYSGGAFEFQLYPDMRLGDEQKTVRALQHGDIQMSVLATNNFMPFAPSCGWLNMPYLFGSLEEFRKLVDLMWDQHNAWAIKESGARVLAIVDIGYRQLTTDAAHPVRNLADARGLAVRTPQNALAVSAFNALGFKPHPASFADTYGMLAKGTVNGQEGCFNNVVTMKFADHQKYATCINYAVHSANIIVNEEWLQGLPEQARDGSLGHRVLRQKRPSSHETIGPSFGRDTPALRAFPDLGETGPPSGGTGQPLGRVCYETMRDGPSCLRGAGRPCIGAGRGRHSGQGGILGRHG